jgi:hypothetical protein
MHLHMHVIPSVQGRRARPARRVRWVLGEKAVYWKADTVSEARIGELEFVRKLQRLLAEGDFTATYKFALLNALADLSVESEAAADGSLCVPIAAIAEKFVEYYWPQASLPRHRRPGRRASAEQPDSATVISTLIERQQSHAALGTARAARSWRGLVQSVARTIRRCRSGSSTRRQRRRRVPSIASGACRRQHPPAARRAAGVQDAARPRARCGPRRVDSAIGRGSLRIGRRS